ncbi:MAG: sigma-54 factor interaction domain-containing protein [Polyangiaceae bacterium]|nr:sigma-54 factor interaction domain-containing protein [Polyangiaceae bacterium]
MLGASGTGKELLARAFHESQGAGPFVAINCATIAPAIAERLLFGAKKGAFTGAEQDAIGHVQAADGGTLFLDEVAELEPGVQAKLLRFLETREFFAVGDVRPRRAEVRVCFATMKDLRSDVASKRFREDLFHRIATPMLELPPLAARRYEIPFLIEPRAATRGLRGAPQPRLRRARAHPALAGQRARAATHGRGLRRHRRGRRPRPARRRAPAQGGAARDRRRDGRGGGAQG